MEGAGRRDHGHTRTAGATERSIVPALELHVCERCRSELVQPVEWAPVDRWHWRVLRRCPECRHVSVGVHDQPTLDRYDAVLDQGTDQLTATLERLGHERAEAEIAALRRALDADSLLPEDF